MRVLVATRSTGKRAEIVRLLASTSIDVVFPDDIGLFHVPREDALELADSFLANARAKAEHFAQAQRRAPHHRRRFRPRGLRSRWRARRPFPAVGRCGRSGRARWTPPTTPSWSAGSHGAGESRRRARYRCVLVYLRDPDAVPAVFEGDCAGRILEEPDGTSGFGYDPLFFSDDLGKSFGRATPEEKDRVSHRGRAFQALVTALSTSI